MASSLLLMAALLGQTADPPFLDSTLLTPPAGVSRGDELVQISAAASQSEDLSRIGAELLWASDSFRFDVAIAKVGLRDEAGFALSDGSSFTQLAFGLGAIVPLAEPVALGASLALTPAFAFRGSADLTTEFDANVSNRFAGEAGLAFRLDLGSYAFLRLASTIEYELTGLVEDLGRDEAIAGRHALQLALSLPDREELGRAHLLLGIASETPYSGYEKTTAAFFTVGVMYGEVFAPSSEPVRSPEPPEPTVPEPTVPEPAAPEPAAPEPVAPEPVARPPAR